MIVDPATGEITTVPTFGFTDDAAFVQDGKMLATAGIDGSVRLWDIEARVSLGTLWDAREPIKQMSYDAETASLWVLLERQIVELTVEPAVWRERACENAGRELTQEEWDLLVPGGGEPKSACP